MVHQPGRTLSSGLNYQTTFASPSTTYSAAALTNT
jgi:hypothetical protein